MTAPIRYAIVGTGARAQMYISALTGPYAANAELTAWSDPNRGRLDWNERRVLAAGAPAPTRIDAEDLSTAVERLRIDRVIVTAPDFAHADLVVAALHGGADVVVEKPLTTDADGVRRIADAVAATGRAVTVTFNYRYSPRNAELKRVIASGAIGDVTSVHFEWLLDTSHGADYFRRWHRQKQNSGGLLVHKSSHHFDLVNWWLADLPVRVFASGGLRFYGARNAERRGLRERPVRGSVDDARRDPFALDLRDHDVLRGLYYEQEQHDGYLRDRDVFDEGISIEDNLSLIVDYAAGASMTYALNAHSPWEGYTVAVNGTEGRAELSVVERGAILLDETGRQHVVDPSARPEAVADETGRPVGDRLVVQRHFGAAREVSIPHAAGGHGGADDALVRDLLIGADVDPLQQAATWLDGVRAMAVGVAGNDSLASGAPVLIRNLDFGRAATAVSATGSPTAAVAPAVSVPR
ncbi:Gfo/Idh/MocA family oxidoreductase [Microbacterium sp. W1N]|uniref:Gfo/Idh/MocA family protein n=1 Tax=Microbacterium festucae TaxID=2977531 RepID=UPI0021C1C8C8|nr:Gfo/Idh/MocA family oxidoreductase [Microbacterium festucae]MCT9821353.1 Gfo/Idh/MocA family oxidoreductase [Microbacterium festucae]